MNNLSLVLAALIGTATAAYTDLPQQLQQVYGESVAAAQQVSTAGDLHSMSVMLDATYVMDRQLPNQVDFETWLRTHFKENNVKDLAIDHWGNPYIYEVSEDQKRYQLRSLGPDGIAETEDDMTKTGP